MSDPHDALAGAGRVPQERPVTPTPACVRAILAGRKSQIRALSRDPASCPLGGPGDLLWVKESQSMTREESRLTLRIRGVRHEHLRSIREEDLAAEGGMWRETAQAGAAEDDRAGFARWWDAVHPKPDMRWAVDPWVWVIEFERAERQ